MQTQDHAHQIRKSDPAQLISDPLKVERRYSQLKQTSGWSEGISDLGPAFTGVNQNLGTGTLYNSPFTARQFLWCLAAIDHPLITRLLAGTSPGQIVNQLVTNQTFKNISVLDIACGCKPAFARSMRMFGATVITADLIDENCLIRDPNIACRGAENEKVFHVTGDISNSGTEAIIQAKMPSRFSIVTHSHLLDGGGVKPNPVQFLKEGGFYLPVEQPTKCSLPGMRKGDCVIAM